MLNYLMFALYCDTVRALCNYQMINQARQWRPAGKNCCDRLMAAAILSNKNKHKEGLTIEKNFVKRYFVNDLQTF